MLDKLCVLVSYEFNLYITNERFRTTPVNHHFFCVQFTEIIFPFQYFYNRGLEGRIKIP